MSDHTLQELTLQLRNFARARDWEQFHSPKNISMALIVEAAELVEHFQWLSEEQSRNLPPKKHAAVAYELADIFIFLIRIADQLNIDLLEITKQKMGINEKRYPVELVKGSSKKHSEY